MGGGTGCKSLVVLMRSRVLIRGRLWRRDTMSATNAGKHISGLGRPARGKSGNASPGH